MWYRKALVLSALVLLFILLAGETNAVQAQEPSPPIEEALGAEQGTPSAPPGEGVIPDQYIVVLAEDKVEQATLVAEEMVAQHKGELLFTYESALKGFAARLDKAAVENLRGDPRVKYIEPDQVVTVSEEPAPDPSLIATSDVTQSNPPWGLDRIDQRALPLNNAYSYTLTGSGVNVYVIDTGIRYSHTQFGGRAFYGADFMGDGRNGNDCNGHGTHVAGTIGGSTYGVAKQVRLYSVRALGCSGSGTWAGVIAAVNWVTANRVLPAVANMSLGGGALQSVNDAVTASINAGVTYVVAAGNESTSACTRSPASTPAALTVAATGPNDTRASFSNYGPCVDLFAPGTSVLSAWHTSDSATATLNGTSMAAPHVAGAVALHLSCNPAASPRVMGLTINGVATANVVQNAGSGSPNRLLYTPALACVDALWWSNGNRTFTQRGALALGAYTPIRGDFDGNGTDDVLWYGPGSAPDSLWWWSSNRTYTNADIQITGTYTPISGDFDGNGRDDILWYAPGSTPDYIWWWNANRTYTSVETQVSGLYLPIAGDFDGNGTDDILWYGPGSAPESIWWWSSNRTYTSQPTQANGDYKPIVGDFDSNGRDDIFWYAAGNATDYIWWWNANRTYTTAETQVSGTYLPFKGDWDGNGTDDIFWYGPGSTADSIWWWNANRTYVSQAATVTGSYKPISGDFDGDGWGDIYWYRAP